MSYLINNQQKVNDIIFASRNKNYGAYVIRSAYGNTMFKSLSIMMLGFGSIILLGYYLSNRGNEPEVSIIDANNIIDSVYTIPFNAEPKPEPPPVHRSTPPPASTPPPSELVSLVNIVDSTDRVVTQAVNVTALAANTSTAPGSDTGPITGPPGSTITGTGTITSPTVSTPPEPCIICDSPPVFDAKNPRALYEFIKGHLRYPERAYDGGMEGTLYVKFVVNEDCSVSNLTLLNHKGFGLDDEAMRVVSMLPKFQKPGIVNDKPVKAYFQLPIKFVLR